MEVDLEHSGGDVEALSANLRSRVCVVGGGIAGLMVAHRLMVAGVSVTLLEAGGREPAARNGADPFSAELRGVPHRGTAEGRVRALGGCSWTWGGQLLPLPGDARWPVPTEELTRYGADWAPPLEAAMFLAGLGVKVPSLLQDLPGFDARLSRFEPFSRRNLAMSMGRQLRASPLVKVALGCRVVGLCLANDRACVSSVEVHMSAGGTLPVAAEQFVLAAGTVETCRVLLASGDGREGVGNAHRQVGRNFHDHLTIAAAVFTGPARKRMLAELGPRVLWAGVHTRAVYSFKLEPTWNLRAELGIHPAMAHLTVEEPEGSGAEELRQWLRAVQTGGVRTVMPTLAKRLPQLAWHGFRLAWDALVRSRRYVSPAAVVRLQLNLAQDVPSASRVLLSSEFDEHGDPKSVVDWRVSAGELASLRSLAKHLRERLASAGIRDGVAWEPSLFKTGDDSDRNLISALDDARHAMGGACMGEDPRTSVVDPQLRVHGVENLSIASPAVFPDGMAQLPTLTLRALCLRLADRLLEELRTAGPARLHSD